MGSRSEESRVKLVSPEKRTLQEAIIQFGGGTQETHDYSVRMAEGFLRAGNNGINRKEQFECVKKWYWKLWREASSHEGWSVPLRPIYYFKGPSS
jgi:hypothetical protein